MVERDVLRVAAECCTGLVHQLAEIEEANPCKEPVVDDFVASARWLAELAARIEPDDWARPGLGVWNVRSLLGHAARALVTVEDYLARPAQAVDTPSAVAYLVLAGKADPAAIAARGVTAGDDLGENPVASVAALVERVSQTVMSTPPEALMQTSAGGMTLHAYLPTRSVELVVHGCDLARALGAEPDPPVAAAASVARLLADAYLSLSTGGAAILCLALAGRPTAPEALVLWPSP
ncbi:MAG: maleylpyruvate isomerase family mycothiol-dependent enzyme [Acidimicrobiales bacterium]